MIDKKIDFREINYPLIKVWLNSVRNQSRTKYPKPMKMIINKTILFRKNNFPNKLTYIKEKNKKNVRTYLKNV